MTVFEALVNLQLRIGDDVDEISNITSALRCIFGRDAPAVFRLEAVCRDLQDVIKRLNTVQGSYTAEYVRNADQASRNMLDAALANPKLSKEP